MDARTGPWAWSALLGRMNKFTSPTGVWNADDGAHGPGRGKRIRGTKTDTFSSSLRALRDQIKSLTVSML